MSLTEPFLKICVSVLDDGTVPYVFSYKVHYHAYLFHLFLVRTFCNSATL